MRKIKVKQLRKEYSALNQKPEYDIKGRIVEGMSWRQYKKLHS